MMEHIFGLSTDKIPHGALSSAHSKGCNEIDGKEYPKKSYPFWGQIRLEGALVIFEQEQAPEKGGLSKVPHKERERKSLTRESSVEEEAIFLGADIDKK